jgi:hypothetical protein
MPKGHTAEMSFLCIEGLTIGTCMPTGGLLDGGADLAGQAVVVRAPMENLITIALDRTLADNDVAVAVNLCGVHVRPLKL